MVATGSITAPSRGATALALGLVYVVWGSTYFAIRVALEGFPPMLMAGIRFVIAGGLLYGLLRARGEGAPTRAGWGAALRIGVLLLVCGNGGVVAAEQKVASGLAATLVAAVPLWTALLSALLGQRPTAREMAGLLLGMGSVVLLQTGGSMSGEPLYAALLLLSTAAWAAGSLWSKRLPVPKGLMGSAAEMLTGGAVLLALGTLRGEHLAAVPAARPLLALAWLVVMGSMAAYSAYTWLLEHVPPALATSYAYVNPVIALGLGALYAGEPVGPRTAVAAAGILVGVALVSWPRRPVTESSS